MHKFFLLLLAFLPINNITSQIIFTAGAHILPAAFVSTERRYFEYFGDNNVQPVLQFGSRLGLEINDRWLIFTGFIYHTRKASSDCLYVVNSSTPFPYNQSLSAFFSNTMCTHTANRDYSILEIPLLLGFKFKARKNVAPYILAGFSPWKKVEYTETRQEKDTGEVSIYRRSYSNEFGYLFYSFLSAGALFKVAPGFNFSGEVVYRSDDKTFKDNMFGLSIGIQYQYKIKK